MIEEALYEVLTDDVAVKAIVQNRVYPITLPQNALFPCLAFTRISTTRHLHHGGNAHVAEARFQITSFAKSPAEAKGLSAAVVNVLHGYKGTVSGETVWKSEVVDENDAFELSLGTYQAPLDVVLTFKE